MTAPSASKSIVLIHGLWLTPLGWEGWVDRFTKAGYEVHTPTWPGMDHPIEELRENPSTFAGVGVADIADHLESVVKEIPGKPIIMGHSFGGLFTQILLDRGYGSAGVAIHPAPAKGVLALPFPALRTASVALRNPLNYGKTVGLNPGQWNYSFTNDMTPEEAEPFRQKYAIPGPAKVLFEAGTANFNPKAATKVNWKNDRAPLLVTGGSIDHTVPPAVSKETAKHQRKSPAITAYKEYEGRTHFTAGSPGWEQVADDALAWAENPVAN
jgi:pimeloyl-ACP methyl ester carboxylesterase